MQYAFDTLLNEDPLKGISYGWENFSPELSSVSYVSLDNLASLVTSVGRGALLVKADIKEAYRMVPIHPSDQHLLEIQWEDSIYIDRMLPLGLCSAPDPILNAEALGWRKVYYQAPLPWFILLWDGSHWTDVDIRGGYNGKGISTCDLVILFLQGTQK